MLNDRDVIGRSKRLDPEERQDVLFDDLSSFAGRDGAGEGRFGENREDLCKAMRSDDGRPAPGSYLAKELNRAGLMGVPHHGSRDDQVRVNVDVHQPPIFRICSSRPRSTR